MVKFLKKNGFIEKGQRGSHKKMINPKTNKVTIVPMHNKDLGNGLDATIALISIDMVAYMRKYHSKVVRKNVSIPEYLAVLAKDQGINASQVLTEALEQKINFG